MSTALERRYRRVLRLLPGWYREQWEQDMVAAFLDSWLTGDQEADEYISRAAGPSAAEVASVAGLAVRLHLGGPGTARRHAWGQAIRRAAPRPPTASARLAQSTSSVLIPTCHGRLRVPLRLGVSTPQAAPAARPPPAAPPPPAPRPRQPRRPRLPDCRRA